MSTQTTTDLPTADAVRAVVPEVLGRTVGGRDGFVVVLIQERHADGSAPRAAATMSALNAVPGWRAYGGTGRDWKTGESSTRITVHGAPPVEREETRAERTMRVLRAAGFTVVDEVTHPAGEDAARTPETVLVNAYGSYRVTSPTHVYGERADEQATYVLRQAGAVVCGSARTTGVVWPDLEPAR